MKNQKQVKHFIDKAIRTTWRVVFDKLHKCNSKNLRISKHCMIKAKTLNARVRIRGQHIKAFWEILRPHLIDNP